MAGKLEESPEFQKAMNEASEKQYRGYLYGGEYIKSHSKDSIAETMEEMQRQRRKIEDEVEGIKKHADQVRRDARIMGGPHMREITANLKRKSGSLGLICPVCGEGDHGNRMNGKPVCMMNAKHDGLGSVLLMTPEKAKEYKVPEKPRARKSYTFNEPEGVTRKRRR